MSKIKVNEIDSRSGTDITVTTGKTLVVPAGGTLDISAATLTPPAVMPASSAANLTNVPGANITGTIPAAALGNVDTTGLQDDIALLAFKTQANGSLARYNLVDQSVDSFEDASGVDASASTNELRNASNYYSGSVDSAVTVSGNYDSNGTDGLYSWYKWTTVTSGGTYTTDIAQDYEYLVIAGGGAGGGQRSGGGGAGGYRTATGFPVAATTISGITVGAGGTPGGVNAGDATGQGANGGNSVFSTITSAGGGGGGGGQNVGSWNDGKNGGSGGGGAANDGAGGIGDQPSTSPDQGTPGGAVNGNQSGAGGGGASAGAGNSGGTTGSAGGAGTSSSIDGTPTTRGGGGGGGSMGGTAGAGGSGGGGGGSNSSTTGTAGTANTGGGGGGAGDSGSGGVGGSGIVIIRRPTAGASPGNMTLVSNTQTAQAQPTKGDLVVTYTNGAGTATINTDLIASVSRDNGTTYTTATLALQGTTGGHSILTAHDLDISGQPAGTSMRWKIATANQSAAKETRIQAVSLGWS